MGGGRAAERRFSQERFHRPSVPVSVVGARLTRAKHGERGNAVVDEERRGWGDPSFLWGLEGGSFDELAAGLADETITRGRAIKLAGAVLAGSVLAVFSPLAGEAEGQELKIESKRSRRRRRRRRRFIRRCRNRGRVVCRVGNKIACCPVSVACSTLPDPLCNVL